MKTRAQLLESIGRFQRGFWNREGGGRPPVAVVPDRVWSPYSFLRHPLPSDALSPADVTSALVRTEYEACAEGRAVQSDDWMPFVAAWRAIPWLEAMCGCAVRAAEGSLAPGRFVEHPAALEEVPIPARRDWFERLAQVTASLAANLAGDCWVSPSILRGCSDVLAAMRGLDAFCLDLYDDPAALARAARRINALHRQVLDMHFGIVPPKYNGFVHIYGYWAPGPTTVLQEDAMGLCSPARYRDLFLEHNAELAAHAGPYTLFHLHSTGYRHYRHVLSIPGLAGLQLTVEASGPPLATLVPMLRETLERSRLILFVDGYFGQLPAALRALPREGLYLMISDKFLPGEAAFQRFLKENF